MQTFRTRERPFTLVRALKAGSWEAAMAQQLDGELLPEDCPYPGPSARRVWEELRDIQLAYQNRDLGWQSLPTEFEWLARALASLAALGA
ncbi:MAG: hypothetical protein ACRDNI_09075 [Gaiellaceae bacterium]